MDNVENDILVTIAQCFSQDVYMNRSQIDDMLAVRLPWFQWWVMLWWMMSSYLRCALHCRQANRRKHVYWTCTRHLIDGPIRCIYHITLLLYKYYTTTASWGTHNLQFMQLLSELAGTNILSTTWPVHTTMPELYVRNDDSNTMLATIYIYDRNFITRKQAGGKANDWLEDNDIKVYCDWHHTIT